MGQGSYKPSALFLEGSASQSNSSLHVNTWNGLPYFNHTRSAGFFVSFLKSPSFFSFSLSFSLLKEDPLTLETMKNASGCQHPL